MNKENGRRLCLLLEAGESRYAIEATAIAEVSPPDASGQTLRGIFELHDLSRLLGGAPELRPGMAVVLDVSPTLAVRVRKVVEVADVALAPWFNIPPGVGTALLRLLRGALVHKDRLYLELNPEALGAAQTPAPTLDVPSAVPLVVAPPRALVFESQGKLFGIPLAWVLQVVPAQEAFCPLDGVRGPVAGLLAHGQALWPVFSVPALLGGESHRETLFILAELAGQHVAICAARVLGVQAGLVEGTAPGEFQTQPGGVPALFLDFQQIFS